MNHPNRQMDARTNLRGYVENSHSKARLIEQRLTFLFCDIAGPVPADSNASKPPSPQCLNQIAHDTSVTLDVILKQLDGLADAIGLRAVAHTASPKKQHSDLVRESIGQYLKECDDKMPKGPIATFSSPGGVIEKGGRVDMMDRMREELKAKQQHIQNQGRAIAEYESQVSQLKHELAQFSPNHLLHSE